MDEGLSSRDREARERRMIGLVGWAVVFGILFAWQGIALISTTDSIPSLSHLLRGITRYTAGRWILFALWLWVGWHLFARGWRIFFANP